MSKEELLFHAWLYYESLPNSKWKTVTRENIEVLKYLKHRGYNRESLAHFGVKLNQNTTYPIIIPIYKQTEFVGYICRRIDGNDDERKYLYSKGFQRKNTLMGTIMNGPVIITEGSLDMIKAWQHGARNVVALLGWKITPYQVEKIKEHSDIVISALDNTPSGRKGTRVLRKHFKKVIRFKFPSIAKDIGDLTRYQWNRCWFETNKKLETFLNKS